MTISELQKNLEAVKAVAGDIEVVSGLVVYGYGQPIRNLTIKEGFTLSEHTNNFDGPKKKVLDLRLDELTSIAS